MPLVIGLIWSAKAPNYPKHPFSWVYPLAISRDCKFSISGQFVRRYCAVKRPSWKRFARLVEFRLYGSTDFKLLYT